MNEAAMQRTPEVGVRWHPYAEIFPWIEGRAFEELKADIAKNGVLEPVVFLGDAILDGRNRYMAARALGIEYPRVEYDGHDPLGFVLAKNLARRHLSESQRGMIAAKLAKMPVGGDRTEQHRANLHSAQIAGKMLNVSERTVKTAKHVQEHGAPELVHAVEAGEVSVSAAAEVASLPKDEQVKVAAAGPKAMKEVAKQSRQARGRDPEHSEWDKRRAEIGGQLSDDVKAAKAARAEAIAAHKDDASGIRIAELEDSLAALEAENASLKAENKKFESMRLQFERGGFEQIIADKDEEIRVLKTRVEAESREKVRNLNSMEYWKKEAIKLGYSRDAIITFDEMADG